MSSWNWKHIYVMGAENGRIKIGISKNVEERARVIGLEKEVGILNVYKTKLCSNPYAIERLCHEHFNDKRIVGEWFDISFDDAVSVVKNIFNKHAEFIETKYSSWNEVDYFHDDSSVVEEKGMILEILLRQNVQIESLMDSVSALSKSNIELANMYKELVSLLNHTITGDDGTVKRNKKKNRRS